ncbi:23745_t:CDS:1 [Dentiscutata erythropus]|uniref:23745_t:CDS:1 n=1 Tax=Dentiscutata erythropus TaxID=1348616 RepID=A0A9N9K9K4_9GLOM|nr:23745_t:CDS:1 [Dentiscutata erythropus]
MIGGNRDTIGDGPNRFLDMFSFVKSDLYNHNYEFFFSEISYGPFSVNNEDHIGDNFLRLAKFGNKNMAKDLANKMRLEYEKNMFTISEREGIGVRHFIEFEHPYRV